jgi:hypothetical protein
MNSGTIENMETPNLKEKETDGQNIINSENTSQSLSIIVYK